MGSALLNRPAQRLAFCEHVFLAEETIKGGRAHAVGKRAIQCVVPILDFDILCEKISQYDFAATLRIAGTNRPRRPGL